MRKRNILIITLLILMACSITSFAATYNESESNNTASSADSIYIATGNGVRGAFSSRDDIDWYKFTLDRGAVIDMTFTSIGTSSGKPGSSEMYITDPDRLNSSSYLYTFEYNSNLGCVYGRKSLHLGRGTYYIKLKSQTSTYSYNIAINSVSYCETLAEPNNNISQAVQINDGAVINGIFASYAYGEDRDNDYLWFYSPNGGQYKISFTNFDVANYGGTTPTLNCINGYGDALNIFGEYSFIGADVGKTTTRQVTLPAGYTYFYAKSSYYGVGGNGRYSVSITSAGGGSSAIGTGTGSSSSLTSAVLTPAKVKGVKLARKQSRYVKVSWKAQRSVTGYKIYRSTKKSKGFKLVKTVKGASKKSFTDKKTKKGKRYYYKVRAYRSVSGRTYLGKFSSVKSIRR